MALRREGGMVFVGFSTPRTWNPLSALIRAITRSRTSHAWLLVDDPLFGVRLVYEAHSTGVRLVSLARFVKGNKVVALVQTRHDLRLGLPAAGEWLGAQFDLLGLFGIFLTLVLRWFRQRPWKNPFPTASALFCSEAVVRAMKAAGYPGSATLGDETTSPEALLAFLRANPSNVVYERDELKLFRHFKAHRRAIRGVEEEVAQREAPAVVPGSEPRPGLAPPPA